jgi:CheY-like chemotaxis protein
MMLVLVVEDEPLIRFLICDLLEEAGFHCAEAGDAEEALALLDGELCRPDILVTDFNLGPGLDGKALAREVLRRLPGLPVAYVTGNPECFEDRPLGPRERLVPKPFASADLVAALRGLHPAAAFLPGTPATPRRELAPVAPA